MTILIAPDSFKGTYTAAEVAAAIRNGIETVGAEAVELPVADGGEGTLDCLAAPLQLEIVTADCVNPWRMPMRGRYGISPDGTAVVEVAEASGITTAHRGRRVAMTADTYGTGMLIADAIARGAGRVLVAAGGSASTDGGRGAINAIRAARVTTAEIIVLTDVVTGYSEAAATFGPQKGADADDVAVLTRRLNSLAQSLPRDPRGIPGSGAAGGLAGGLWAAFDATIVPGADYVLDACNFDRLCSSATAVVVGEGRLDSQTLRGKIISAILRRAAGRPVYAVVGSVGDYAGDDFADVIVASDLSALEKAGASVAVACRSAVGR